jgi:hypothetical protein
MAENRLAKDGQRSSHEKGQEADGHPDCDAVERRHRDKQQRVSACMIGIVVKAIQPDDATSQDEADYGGSHQQPTDEEN